ncbi:uncharacterized protein Dwil_GK28029 [Drosophila willistoni]|uniref:Gustatory receptor n=1 Tax=Drosophila willistoni TaxID=7260 RepID=A0A0Q9X087_DROWI|nr:uncharacterized protein Dwil_GK28029 [Drosophila willistoni]
MYLKAYTHAKLEALPRFLLAFTYTFSFVLIGIVVVFYNCLVQVLSSLVRRYNEDLSDAATTTIPSTAVWRLRLEQRNRLIWVCYEHLNRDFGLVMTDVWGMKICGTPWLPLYYGTCPGTLLWLISLVAAFVGIGCPEGSITPASMSTCRDLRLYIQLLNALGMMCCQLDEGPCLVTATPRCERYALSYTMGVIATSMACFTYAHMEPQRFYMLIYNRTGNFYETVNFRCTCLVLILLYVCLYFRRRRHVSLVQILLTLNRECLSSGLDRRFLNNLILYGVLLLLCFGNYLNGYCHAGMSTSALTIYVLVNTYAFVVLCLLLIFFVCLKQIMAGGLLHYNQQMMLGFARPKYIRALRERQKLLALCAGELNECFGLLMLPIVALVLLKMPSGPFYLISTVMEELTGLP